MINEGDYVDLGLACGLYRPRPGLNGRLPSEPDGSVCEAINQLTT